MNFNELNNFVDFTKKYGVDTTTNFQLIKWAKELNIKHFYCLMRDEIKVLKNKKQYYCICNLHIELESYLMYIPKSNCHAYTAIISVSHAA